MLIVTTSLKLNQETSQQSLLKYALLIPKGI